MLAVRAHWMQILAAGDRPPLTRTTTTRSSRYVAAQPGGVGYVSEGAVLPDVGESRQHRVAAGAAAAQTGRRAPSPGESGTLTGQYADVSPIRRRRRRAEDDAGGHGSRRWRPLQDVPRAQRGSHRAPGARRCPARGRPRGRAGRPHPAPLAAGRVQRAFARVFNRAPGELGRPEHGRASFPPTTPPGGNACSISSARATGSSTPARSTYSATDLRVGCGEPCSGTSGKDTSRPTGFASRTSRTQGERRRTGSGGTASWRRSPSRPRACCSPGAGVGTGCGGRRAGPGGGGRAGLDLRAGRASRRDPAVDLPGHVGRARLGGQHRRPADPGLLAARGGPRATGGRAARGPARDHAGEPPVRGRASAAGEHGVEGAGLRPRSSREARGGGSWVRRDPLRPRVVAAGGRGPQGRGRRDRARPSSASARTRRSARPRSGTSGSPRRRSRGSPSPRPASSWTPTSRWPGCSAARCAT